MKDIYSIRIQNFSLELEKKSKQSRLLAISRLVSFLLIFPAVIFLWEYAIPLSLGSGLVLLILFLYLVKRNINLDKKILHLKHIIEVNQIELAAIRGDSSAFENGNEFVDAAHPFSHDMDLFGEDSLFQFLNRTVTLTGKNHLSKSLNFPSFDFSTIGQKQEAVDDASSRLDLRQHFGAYGKLFQDSEQNYQLLLDWLHTPIQFMHKKIFSILIWIIPVITLGVLVAGVFYTPLLKIGFMFFLVQLFITGTYLKKINRIHQSIEERKNMLEKYHTLLNLLYTENFKTSYLKELAGKIADKNAGCNTGFLKLLKINTALDTRLNFLVGIILNGFVLWDIRTVIRLEKWKQRYVGLIADWFDILGQFDAIFSLANFRYNHPEYAFPVNGTEDMLKAKKLGHPLIPANKRVVNDYKQYTANEFVIITGANMAGKSTFLRTVGVNLVLAMAGAPVCARSFVFQPKPIFSSMRTTDSLQKNESYFYAELKRLHFMLAMLKEENKPFILLDEILKGTNSKDKQEGSAILMEKIIGLQGSGMIATHDLALATIEKKFPDRIKNRCFEIELDGSEIKFDYKLQAGVSKKMNAQLLMKSMGIL